MGVNASVIIEAPGITVFNPAPIKGRALVTAPESALKKSQYYYE
jgi:hypothetical protein